MQKFSYHCHTNSFGVFDGANSISEMMENAVKIGFEEIGISNHIICNKACSQYSKMYFIDFNKAFDVYKATAEAIRKEAQNHKIKVRVGFEVDFFFDKEWRNNFEKHIKTLDHDYLIGTTHNISNDDESHICNLYELRSSPVEMNEEQKEAYLREFTAFLRGKTTEKEELEICRNSH